MVRPPIDQDTDDETATPDAPPDESRPRSRRELFRLGAAALAGATLLPARRAHAQRIQRPRSALPPAPKVPDATTTDAILRLVSRVTMGTTSADVAKAKSMGYTKYLDWQLDYKRIADTEVENFVAATWPTTTQTGEQIYNLDFGIIVGQLQQAALYRAAFSQRQLYERMVEFWTDHFNIDIRQVGYLKTLDDREVIRKHALGSFKDLLNASARSAAMLEYLDNTRSRGSNPNQNYARELMELHTLGVDGGYTQDDVANLAKILTGWTIAGRGNFNFDPRNHDFGAKTFLGQAFPAQSSSIGLEGIREGERAIDMLLKHPSTARYIAFKMTRWLLRYDPPAELVTKVAAVFTKTEGNIPAMIREILRPANLLAAPMKLKRPFHLVASAMRATGVRPAVLTRLSGTALALLGQQSFYWEDPDGYPDSEVFWAGGVLQRWNFATTLATTTTGDVVVDIAPFTTVNTPDGVCSAIAERCYAGQMPDALRQRVTTYLAAGTLNAARVREGIALALGSSTFQWY